MLSISNFFFIYKMFTLSVIVLLLCGCTEQKFKQILGANNTPPDEFLIFTYPELKMPDKYDSVPSPSNSMLYTKPKK